MAGSPPEPSEAGPVGRGGAKKRHEVFRASGKRSGADFAPTRPRPIRFLRVSSNSWANPSPEYCAYPIHAEGAGICPPPFSRPRRSPLKVHWQRKESRERPRLRPKGITSPPTAKKYSWGTGVKRYNRFFTRGSPHEVQPKVRSAANHLRKNASIPL